MSRTRRNRPPWAGWRLHRVGLKRGESRALRRQVNVQLNTMPDAGIVERPRRLRQVERSWRGDEPAGLYQTDGKYKVRRKK